MIATKRSTPIILAAVAATALAATAAAQWRQTSGPAGGSMFTIAADGDTAIATGGAGAIFRSTDGGEHWVHSAGGGWLLTGFNRIGALGGGEWLASEYDAVHYSLDDGRTWSAVTPAGLQSSIEMRAVAGEGFATGRDPNFVRQLYHFDPVTLDWTHIAAPESVQGFLVEGNLVIVSNETAYAPAVHRSYDGGQTWETFTEDLPVLGFDEMVRTGSGDILALSQGDGLWRSADNGATWTQAVDPAVLSPQEFFALGGDLYTRDYSGVVNRSRDDGQTWSEINNGLTGIRGVALSNSRYLVVAGEISRSDDDAQTWTASHDGIVATSPQKLYEIDGVVGVTQSGAAGLDVTLDSGDTWMHETAGLPAGVAVTAYYQVDDNVRLVGTHRDGVYRSTNGGQTWQPANSGIPQYQSSAFGSSYHRPIGFARVGNDIFVATGGGAEVIGGTIGQPYTTSSGAGVFRSSNLGQSWQAARAGIPVDMINPLSGSAIYASGAKFAEIGGALLLSTEEHGVFRSTDQATSWQAANSGLSAHDGQVWPAATAFIEVDGAILLAGRSINYWSPHAPLFGSIDGGATWAEWTTSLGDNRGIAGMVEFGGRLVAALQIDYQNPGAPIFHESTDGGAAWSPMVGDAAGLRVNDLINHAGELFAATTLGVWRYDAVVVGDVNCDGSVNFGDIDPFVLLITAPTDYANAYPDCDPETGDVNGDGLVNFGDIDPFVATLTGA